MILGKCMVGKQVSGQHTLEKEQSVITDSFADPEIWGLLLIWLKTELNWCLGPEGRYRFRLCHLLQTQRDLERASTHNLEAMILLESAGFVQRHTAQV